jgi:putative FmdB family regulatory protein
MPTYEYIREDGTRFDRIQKMSDKPLTHCPDTGQPVVRSVSGGAGVIYRGNGFYNTDYKAKPMAKESEARPVDAGSETAAAETSAKAENLC